MHAHYGSGVFARLEEWVPVACRIVERGKIQMRWQFGESHRPHPPLRVPSHLDGSKLRIPEGDEAQRDQAACAFAAPFVDHPVVVGDDTGQGELPILSLEERLPAESRHGGEAQGPLDMILVHVDESFFDPEGPWTHVVEAPRLMGDPFGRLTHSHDAPVNGHREGPVLPEIRCGSARHPADVRGLSPQQLVGGLHHLGACVAEAGG